METIRFGIKNWLAPVSRVQYTDVVQKLESTLTQINPELQARLKLTTNRQDYFGAGSLTIITPETVAALNRRISLQINELSEELWQEAFKTTYLLTGANHYSVFIETERRNPKRITFYGQGLDEKSQKALLEFKQRNRFKIIDSGYSKPTLYSIVNALNRLTLNAQD
jgi:hypothetical protein